MSSSELTLSESSLEAYLQAIQEGGNGAPSDQARLFLAKAERFWNKDDRDAVEQLPLDFGKYRLKQLLGSGGFGNVYLAEDMELKRQVALKLPHPSVLLHPEMRKRWEREARATGTIEHPHIVRLIEAGEIDGKWYLASEYVPGINLAKWLALQKPNAVTPREIARFLSQVTDAIAQAHRQGVIHRDLKPSNILLKWNSPVQIGSLGECTPKITDFGLAKWLEDSGLETQSGVLLGTLQYMAPEQAELRHGDIGPSTDIYALGLLLFELATQQPLLSPVPMLPMIQQIIQKEAPRLRKFRSDCPIDLETICAKCLEKQTQQRYTSAQALHDDLLRFSHGEPIAAKARGLVDRLNRWIKRELVFATSLFFTFLVLVMVLGGVIYHSHQTEEANGRIRAALRHTQQLHYDSTIQRASQLVQLGNATEASQILSRCRDEMEEYQTARTWEWKYLWNRVQRMPRHFRWHGHQDTPYALAYSHSKQWVASGDGLGVLMIRDANSGKVLHTIQSPKGTCRSLAFSPDSRWLAQLCGDNNVDSAIIWDTSNWSVRMSQSLSEEVFTSLCFHPQQEQLVMTSKPVWNGIAQGKVLTWNYLDRTSALKTILTDNCCQRIWWSHGQKAFVLATMDAFILYDDHFQLLRSYPGPHEEIKASTSSPNGLWYTWANGTGLVNLFDLRRSTSKPHRTWNLQRDWVYDLEFSPSSKLLASCGKEQQVQVRDVETGNLVTSLGNKGNSHAVTFTPDEQSLFFTSSDDLAVHRWYFGDASKEIRQVNLQDQVWSLAWSPSDKTLLVGLDDIHTKATIRQIEPTDGKWRVLASHELSNGCVTEVLPLKNNRVISATMNGELALLDLKANKLIHKVATHQERGIRHLVQLDPGKGLATSGHDGLIRFWNQDLHSVGEPLDGHEGKPVRGLCYDSKYQQLYSAGNDKRIVQWDVNSQQILRVHNDDFEIHSMCLSNDGQMLAYGNKLGDIVLLSLKEWKIVRRFKSHDDQVTDIIFSPDDLSLISGDFSGHLILWNVQSGERLLNLPKHQNRISSLLWSKDGSKLYSGSLDGRIMEHDFHMAR